ncbi:MAG: glycine--tRNA ligase subunit beta [Syntrophobacteraceae bacterium]|nr:glycine--tRNA ligase subunit beta [Syntrophobacteraceae bacterium]
MAQTLYIEIGTEEIPAGYIRPALEWMSAWMAKFLDENRIAHGEPAVAGTPRRLVLNIPGVAESQQAVSIEVVGPPKSAAYDARGKPTKAAEGFAKGQGVSLSDIRIKLTPKGEYLCVLKEETGRAARQIIEKALPDFLARIPFAKSMHWASYSETFARPVQWIVAMLGGEVLQCSYAHVTSGNKSMGHRFMSPEWIEVKDFESHRENLRKNHVILDMAERRELIRQGSQKAAAEVGGHILADEELLEEVTQLVEFPQPLVGQFEDKYLELPPELLITVIKKHQRYFAVTDGGGALLPYFVTISNVVPRDASVVAAGNGRVVRARLEDARFYYGEDQKVRLDDRVEHLKGVVFHSKIGTSFEKMERFRELALMLAERVAAGRVAAIGRAAELCKADLVSGVVGEFPELQGIMGKTYARLQGEPESVCQAIYEHYLPNRSGGPVPQSMEGALLSIADKIDTIAACFGVGLLPTGTTDPFALRRQTLGIIRIVLETPLRISLGDLLDKALAMLSHKLTQPAENVKRDITAFFEGRLHHYLASSGEGLSPDVIDAALAAGVDDLLDAVERTRALARFTQRPDFTALAAAFKRVGNIIKSPETAPVEASLFKSPAEGGLYDELIKAEDSAGRLLARSDFAGALEAMAQLKPMIDSFFDSVLVMDSDESVKRNRLALLTRTRAFFDRMADFRKIQTS